MAQEKRVSLPEAISASLLELAGDLDGQGKVHQALPLYLEVIERYPDSEQAWVAMQRVLAIAQSLRKAGKPHAAVTVLDRLEAAYQAR